MDVDGTASVTTDVSKVLGTQTPKTGVGTHLPLGLSLLGTAGALGAVTRRRRTAGD